MKIPKQFQLFGSTITVEFSNAEGEQNNVYGLSKYDENKIVLSDKVKYIDRAEIEIEATFWHEVIHFIFNRLDYHKLNDDEQLISLMARSMQQIMNSME